MKSLKYTITTLLLFFYVITNANIIKGYVYDFSQKKEPLIGVNIFWLGTTHGTITDQNGYFEISNHTQNQVLVFSYVGYKTDSIKVKNKSEITVFLKQGSKLNEVTVNERIESSRISKINPILTQKLSSKELTKFACCNLSESFETNASVDVAYADAVSGIKQIKMLGLSGRYSQLMLENVPIIRGSETAFGLDYIPGTWMESIQISKGTSAVKNGFESITGQINISFKNPDKNEKLHFYFYGNQDGKIESNAGVSFKVNNNWNTNLLVHVGSNTRSIDMNHDGFLDKPQTLTGSIINRWNYTGKKVESKLAISYLQESRQGGQLNYNHNMDQSAQLPYGIGIDVNRLNAFSKIGFLINRSNTSIGWISSANYFQRESFYGFNTLDVNQVNVYTNLMFQSYIINTKHTYTTGISTQYDNNKELFSQNNNYAGNVGFEEVVGGLFFEYNYIPSDKLSFLLGIREDFSNIHGSFFTPRIHTKYNFTKILTLRASLGKGYRTPSVISENTPLLATSKQFIIEDKTIQEEAWNYGVSFYNEIPIQNKKATITFEYFKTDFINQLIVDLEQDNEAVYFYNLKGKSYANSFQVEAFYELFKRFELTGGFRYNDVKANFNDNIKKVPFQSNYKALLSAQYRTNLDKWQFDATIQFHGKQRLPYAGSVDYFSDEYLNIIAQITKNYKYWSFYVGAENLNNFTQKNAIISPENPFGNSFDASQIWGPLYGRMFYVGIKYILDKRF